MYKQSSDIFSNTGDLDLSVCCRTAEACGSDVTEVSRSHWVGACVAVKNVISKNIQGLFDKFFFYLLLVRH